MTIDERVNDVMAKLHSWIEQGAHKRFHWDERLRQHVMESDEETRRAIIKLIVEVGRQDGAKAEREACAMIVHEVFEREFKMFAELKEYSDAPHCIIEEIENKIRARSESKKTEPKQLLTFNSLCVCGHVMSDHGYGDESGYGGCLNARCRCHQFCSRSEGKKKGE